MLSHAHTASVIGRSVTNGVQRLWPPRPEFTLGSPISMSALARQFAEAGALLSRLVASTDPGVWERVARADLASSVRHRLLDPAIMDQVSTGLCGPIGVLFELSRRSPAEYVRAATQLFEKGRYTMPTGRTIRAEQELRDEVVPEDMASADWVLAGTMRDDENWIEDVDSDKPNWPVFLHSEYHGLETLTWPLEIKYWIQDLLQLRADVDDCWADGEIEALRAGSRAVAEGGVAILCIDSNLLKHQEGDTEEEIYWRSIEHSVGPDGPEIGSPSERNRSTDDSYFPTHWAPLVEPVTFRGRELSARLWSWNSEFLLTGTKDAFSEYLYNVVIGHG